VEISLLLSAVTLHPCGICCICVFLTDVVCGENVVAMWVGVDRWLKQDR